MDSYTVFKVLVSKRLLSLLEPSVMKTVISCLDDASEGFTVTMKNGYMSTLNGGMPDALRFFLDAKTVEEKSPGTIELYRGVLTHFFVNVNHPVREITTDQIREYMSLRKHSGNKNITIGNVRKILSSFFEWCVMEGHAPTNPVHL